jgi:ABC-type multidrug transport system fused ATPase/permease subunit
MNAKLDTARVFERIFDIYKDQFTLLIPAALVVFVPVAIISGIVYAGDVSIIGVAIISAVATIATYWFQGMVVEAARDILDGRRDHTVGTLIQSATPVVVPLLVAGILAGIGIGIGLILLIVPGLFLLTIWAVIAPVIVIERRGALESFGRSRELVRGSGWQVFGVIVVLFLLQFIVSAVIQALANSVSDSFGAYAIADLLVRLLVAPLSALAAAVLFFELKAIHGEPVLGTGAGGQVTPSGEPAGAPAPTPERPAGGPAPTPAEPPPPGPEPPARPSAPEAPPPPPAGPTTGNEGSGSDRPA